VLGACLWASGGQTVLAASGSGIIEAIPGAWDIAPAPPVGTLGILSYNLAYGLGRQGDHGPRQSAAAIYDSLDQVIETIVASDADIALLQEVDFASQRTHDIDQLYYIAAALGWGYAARAVTWECRYLPWPLHRPTGRLRAGMGVISRYPLIQNVRQRLPQAWVSPLFLSRCLARHTVQMVDVQCGATLLRLLNVYLAPQQMTKRQQHVQALVTFVREVYTPTSVLMGTVDTAADRLASEQSIPMLIAELGERCRAMPEPGEHAATAMLQAHSVHALVGSGLQPLGVRTAEVQQPPCAHPPLILRLRWALPLLTRHGQPP
jgi:endonuclease/exonuclease/phosphatase family metal-dependent hydrolase